MRHFGGSFVFTAEFSPASTRSRELSACAALLSSRLVFAYADADLFYSAEYVTKLLEPYHCLLRSACLPCLCSSRALRTCSLTGVDIGWLRGVPLACAVLPDPRGGGWSG